MTAQDFRIAFKYLFNIVRVVCNSEIPLINQNPAWKGTINRVGVISQDGFWLNFSRARPEGKHMAKLFEDGLQQLKRSGRYDEIMRNFRTRMGVPDLAASNSQ